MANRRPHTQLITALLAASWSLWTAAPSLAQQQPTPAPGAPAYRIPLKQARIPEGMLSGSLTGPQGPLAGAILSAQPAAPGSPALSIPLEAATGNFEVKLPPGKYLIEGSAPGHNKLQVEIEVRDKYRVKVPLQLKPTAPPLQALPTPPPAPTPAPAASATEQVNIRYDQDSSIGAEIDESRVNKLPLKEKISFGPNEIELPGSASALLDKLAALLQKNNALVRIEVTGYAGPSGKADLDQRNSLRRATAVKNYLVGKGIAQARVRIQGLGAKPGEQGRADQVEFVLWQVSR